MDAAGIPRRALGSTGETVTTLGYGALEIQGPPRGPAMTDVDVGSLLHKVLDAGINLIDTSIEYGRSEELIGRHIGARRDEYFLASKCGCHLALPDDATPPYPHDYSAANVRAGVEQSLRRLRTDHLDLVQVHMSPARTQMEADGTIDEMLRLREEGKIRFLGISGIEPNLTDHIDMGVFDVFQVPYSALQRDHEDLISCAAQRGAGVLVRGGTARGTAAEEKQWASQPYGLPRDAAHDRWKSAEIDHLLDGMTRHEFVLRFTLSHPGLSSAIVGTSRLGHLRLNIEIAARGPLSEEIYAEARRRLPGPEHSSTMTARP